MDFGKKGHKTFSLVDYLVLSFSLLNLFHSKETYLLNETSEVILNSTICYFSIVMLLSKIGRNKLLEYLIYCVFLCLIIQTTFIILQLIGILSNPNQLFKIGGSFGHPGYTFGIISLGILFSVCNQIFYQQNRYFVLFFLLCAFFLMVVSIAVISRASILVFGLALISILEKSNIRIFSFSKLKRIVVLSIVISILLILGYLKIDSIKGRLFIWKNTIALIMQKPLTGHGSGSFTTTYNRYQTEYFRSGLGSTFEQEAADYVILAYNDFLEIGLELGILGLGALITIFFLFSKQAYRNSTGYVSIFPLVGFLLLMSMWGVLHENIYCNFMFITFAFCRNISV